jgi:hypothetical protein
MCRYNFHTIIELEDENSETTNTLQFSQTQPKISSNAAKRTMFKEYLTQCI